ncbi:hypothetical protein [Streptomyces sp. NPDC057280]|uniref:hypothetical protein n=1 Tax=Streptomyces sp. NPDC057280 TaxID=3346081 RepID=UPI00363EA3E1
MAVPAVIIVFTIPPDDPSGGQALAFSAGLLVVTVIGNIIGVIALAAIGAEQSLTPNLTPAIMFAAVSVVIALVDVVAAFEILASLALPHARLLLQLITGIAGSLGVFFTALALGDSWATHPANSPHHGAWRSAEWITSQREGTALRVAEFGVLPVLAGTVRRASGLHRSAGTAAANTVILNKVWLSLSWPRSPARCAHGIPTPGRPTAHAPGRPTPRP